jgi:hypothetical protein
VEEHAMSVVTVPALTVAGGLVLCMVFFSMTTGALVVCGVEVAALLFIAGIEP